LNLTYYTLLSSFAFNFNLRRYTLVDAIEAPPQSGAELAAESGSVESKLVPLIAGGALCSPRHPPRCGPSALDLEGIM